MATLDTASFDHFWRLAADRWSLALDIEERMTISLSVGADVAARLGQMAEYETAAKVRPALDEILSDEDEE